MWKDFNRCQPNSMDTPPSKQRGRLVKGNECKWIVFTVNYKQYFVIICDVNTHLLFNNYIVLTQ